jgi:outer membrane immunogenic protein
MKFGRRTGSRAPSTVFRTLAPTRFSNNRSCAGSATISAPAFGVQTVNCFETDLVSNTLRLQSHMATFGLAYKFN